MKKYFFLLLFIQLFRFTSSALVIMQERIRPTIGGYLEMYYLYNFKSNQDHLQPSFLYSYNRNNEVSLNLGLIQFNYESSKIKMNFGLMVGTYPTANLAGEPPIFRNIYEASIAFRASKKRKLWVEAGIFPSHLGFESAIGSDNNNLTRSLCAESSPYYESGVRVSWNSGNDKWYLAALYLNGWQHMVRSNNTPAFGTQLIYKKDEKLLFNWSTFIGNEYPDTLQRWRFFNNLYTTIIINGRMHINFGVDFGIEQKITNKNDYAPWFTPTLSTRYQINTNNYIGYRFEYFLDEYEIIIPNGGDGTSLFGFSINYDRKINDLIFWRTEARFFSSKTKIFELQDKPSYHNFFIGTSLSVKF